MFVFYTIDYLAFTRMICIDIMHLFFSNAMFLL